MSGFELRIGAADHATLWEHLHRPDLDEYGAIALAGVREHGSCTTLYVRELHLADEEDFEPALVGYRQFSARMVAEMGGRAAEEGLAYVAIHSHPSSHAWTRLSQEDLDSHRRLFPHLLDLTAGGGVAGIAVGTGCAAGELWMPERSVVELERYRVIGPRLVILVPGELPTRLRQDPAVGAAEDDEPRPGAADPPSRFDRQVRLFGAEGQRILSAMRVGVIGAGGGGSLLVEQLAHLGVGQITVVDYDVVKNHNLSRIVGAVAADAERATKKVEVMRRLVDSIDPEVELIAIDGDIGDLATAEALLDLDYLFLATDTITSRLVFNAIVHRFLIPGALIGAKVELGPEQEIASVYIAVRPVLPECGCLDCAGLIDAMALQREARGEAEAAAQNYLGTAEVIDPSVITLNAIAASQAANTMLLQAVGLLEIERLEHKLFFPLEDEWLTFDPPKDPECLFCGTSAASGFARGGSGRELPCRRLPREKANPAQNVAGEAPSRSWIARLIGRLRRG